MNSTICGSGEQLSAAAAGTTSAGLAGTLIGMGILEHMAGSYEGPLKNGQYLIAVQDVQKNQAELVTNILQENGAESISSLMYIKYI